MEATIAGAQRASLWWSKCLPVWPGSAFAGFGNTARLRTVVFGTVRAGADVTGP